MLSTFAFSFNLRRHGEGGADWRAPWAVWGHEPWGLGLRRAPGAPAPLQAIGGGGGW
jgi:hypothetical protein